MGDVEKVKGEVAETAGASFLDRIAERVGGKVTATAVFGEPVEREGVTVIPVARAAFGFGGGSGEGEGQTGSGGGGGGTVKPLGFIEVRASGAQFKPLRTGPSPVLIAAAAGLAALALRRRARG